MTEQAQVVEAVFTDVSKSAINTDVRMNLGMVPGEVAHQGDVYVVMVDNKEDLYGIHKNLTKCDCGEKTANRQLAPGTTKGSRHIAEGPMTIFAPPQEASALEGPYIEASSEWTLTHPEHADHKMPAGKFCIVYQRDFAAEEIRRVAD